MRALVNHARAAVELREVDEPVAGAGEAVLDVLAAGVCGSDVHQWQGHQSWPVEYPVVLGHEFVGRVASVGPGVERVALGDRVVSETAAWIDPLSPYVRTGAYNVDPTRRGFGTREDGAMAERVRVPVRCLHAVADAVPDHIAGITEPGCVAYNAVCVQSAVRPGDAVAVIGPGAIGLLCAWMARRAGASVVTVVGTERDAARLQLARALGADRTVTNDVATHDVDPAALGAIADGFDLVVDAAGHSATLQLALHLVRPNGQITKVGWGPQPLGFSLDALVAKAVTLRGAFSHTWDTWERVLGLYAEAHEELEPIVGWRGPLERWSEAFEASAAGGIVKAVLEPRAVPR